MEGGYRLILMVDFKQDTVVGRGLLGMPRKKFVQRASPLKTFANNMDSATPASNAIVHF